ncbi:hypothetical protein [uncultured Maribacter sp.]|uniref:hypothetical protein n=1 Tax=uncultured Maribacter sp. TaxID=431308 RepID=UPI00262A6AB2|nr:hypothetical protein [uncultured Maribacter sp.]
MKLFPSKYFTVELREDRVATLNELKRNTKLTDNLISSYTDKKFIGKVNDGGFKIISSEIGRGAVCVFTGELQDSLGELEIRIHNAFKVMFSILLSYPLIGFGLITYNQGFEKAIKLLPILIIGLLFIRFVFIELSFRFISKTGLNKLTKTIGIKTRHNKTSYEKP